MFTDGVALDNTIRDNANVGLRFSDTTGGYARNVINGNSSPVLNGTQIGTNLCDGNTTCP